MRGEKLLVIFIFFLALGLRLFGLGTNPPSLNWDEVSMGYNAYSILKTGADEWGQPFPLTNFRAYGDYPLPLYMYLAMPGIFSLGLNEFAIRLPSALFGSLMVFITYFLAKSIFLKTPASLISAFLIAVSPWSLLTSRQVIQATPALFFYALGILLLIKGVAGKKIWLGGGMAFLGLSAYAYHNTRILAPLVLLLFLFIFRRFFAKKKLQFFSVITIAAIFFIPLVPVLFSREGTARSVWVGILNEGTINRINEARSKATLPQPLPQLIHNKATYFIAYSASNYLGYFSPFYLGFQGGTHYQFSIPNFGVVFPIELPFFYLGIILLLLKFPQLETVKKFLLFWLLIAPVPAAITRDPYQVVRAMTMLPVVYLITGFGFGAALDYLYKKKTQLLKPLIIIFILGFVVLLGRYLHNFWFVYPRDYSFAWQYGYKEVVQYIKENGDGYQRIVITKKYGEPHEFLLFYLGYDPLIYRNNPALVRYEKSNWYWVDRFDKFDFMNDWEIKERLLGADRQKILVITSPGNYPQQFKLLETINFLNNQPAFDIVEL